MPIADADAPGRFGPYGGRYVPETLIAALDALEREYRAAQEDPAFRRERDDTLRDFAGRPTPLVEAHRFSASAGCRVFLKREDLLHTGAHKINNTIGQCLLTRRMGKPRVIAETGAGQHGVATAAAAARVGLACVVYMGVADMRRQALNVERLRLRGAEVRGVDSGPRTLKDAHNEALRDWVSDPLDTYYLLGSAVGPHPYPYLVRELQSVIGREARAQMLAETGALPDVLIACVGGGSNAIGIFHPFVADAAVEIIGIEAGGRGAGVG